MTHRLLHVSLFVSILFGTLARTQAEPTIGWSVKLENKFVHKDRRTVYALVRLNARESQDKVHTQPINLALVVDRSGSMSGDKIEDARQAALKMVERMRDGDRVSLISYSTDVRVDFPSARLDKKTRREVTAAIYKLSATGYTNLSGGLTEGHKQVADFLDPDATNRVLLISDGLANRGITDTKQLNQIAREVFQKGIITTTIGVGADYNEDLMTAVADHGGGNYYFLKDSSEIASALNREVSQMMATVAKRVSIVIEVAGGVEVQKVHGWLTMDDGNTKVVRLSELFAGQSRSVLCELSLPESKAKLPRQTPLGKIALHYTPAAGAGEEILESQPLAVTVTDDKSQVAENVDLEVSARITEIRVATQLQTAADLVKAGSYDDAKLLLQSAAETAQSTGSKLGTHGKDLAVIASQAKQLAADVDKAKSDAKAAKLLGKGAASYSFGIGKK